MIPYRSALKTFCLPLLARKPPTFRIRTRDSAILTTTWTSGSVSSHSARLKATPWSLFTQYFPELFLKPYFGPHDSMLPQLPKIQSESIKTQVFTHRSLHGRPTHAFEDPTFDPSPDNEKLEHLGDSVLNLVTTQLMLEAYPRLKVGSSTIIRSLVVQNANLASISLKYGLPHQLRLHPAYAVGLINSARVQADLFEAFVGGLFLDQGMEAVNAWLRPLLTSYIEVFYRIVRKQHGLPPPMLGANNVLEGVYGRVAPTLHDSPATDDNVTTTTGYLAFFNQHVQRQNIQVEWSTSFLHVAAATNLRDNNHFGKQKRNHGASQSLTDSVSIGTSTLTWLAKVSVDNHIIGTGTGHTKKAAKEEAAKQGLEKLGIQV